MNLWSLGEFLVGKMQKSLLYQSVAELRVVPGAGESLYPLSKPAATNTSPTGLSFTAYCTSEMLHLLAGQIQISCQMSR